MSFLHGSGLVNGFLLAGGCLTAVGARGFKTAVEFEIVSNLMM